MVDWHDQAVQQRCARTSSSAAASARGWLTFSRRRDVRGQHRRGLLYVRACPTLRPPSLADTLAPRSWEFLVSFGFDWDHLARRRPLRWPIIVRPRVFFFLRAAELTRALQAYLGARYTCLLAVVASFRVSNVFQAINGCTVRSPGPRGFLGAADAWTRRRGGSSSTCANPFSVAGRGSLARRFAPVPLSRSPPCCSSSACASVSEARRFAN